jgi:hypothetical protein
MNAATATAAKIDWDAWRADYDTMTFADQQAFYAQVAELHPRQESFDLEKANEAFDKIGGSNLIVVELGGWDGRLARDMLARTDIATWENWDIADLPQVCTRENYRRELLDDYLWTTPIDGDVFVACHTIEHLKARELQKLFAKLRTSWVYLEAPLSDDGTDWTGYPGSHILEIGWEGVNELLSAWDYHPVHPGLWRKA